MSNFLNRFQILLASCVMWASVGAASPTYPVLIKLYDNGLVPPSAKVSKRCEVYRNYVRLVVRVGSSTTETLTTIAENDNFLELITTAASGPIIVDEAPTDGPTTIWRAEFRDDNSTPIAVQLKAEGSAILQNKSDAAATLINILNENCTFDRRMPL